MVRDVEQFLSVHVVRQHPLSLTWTHNPTQLTLAQNICMFIRLPLFPLAPAGSRGLLVFRRSVACFDACLDIWNNHDIPPDHSAAGAVSSGRSVAQRKSFS